MAMQPFGVYVHIPFCLSRCDYCAFATWTDRFNLVDDYVAACTTAARRQLDGGRLATSVFFGGGTPSLLDAHHIESILSAIPRADGAEVTVECNPDTVDEEKLIAYRGAGVRRLSFGVQSMRRHVLEGLGRRHDPESVGRAVAAAGAAGFGHAYSVDLIMGGAGESLDDWSGTLAEVLALQPGPRHVSAYGLTVEPGTPLAKDAARHPDPDDQADKYAMADEILTGAGLPWYEISNWAAAGAECRHNQLYWSQGEYCGIGCAAHSHSVDRSTGWARRWWNVRTPERYIQLIDGGGTGESAGEELAPAARVREGLELALRTSAGVPQRALPGWDTDEVLRELVRPADNGRLVLTQKGRLLANEVAIRLSPPQVTGARSFPPERVT